MIEEERQPWLLSYWQDPSCKFHLQGRTQFKQIPVYAIEVTNKDSRPCTLFIDSNNYLVVAISYQAEIPERESDRAAPAKLANVSVEYSEYRPNGGAMVPFKISRSINNSEVENIALANATVGGAIDDSSFYRPSAGTAWHIPRSVTVPFDYSEKGFGQRPSQRQ